MGECLRLGKAVCFVGFPPSQKRKLPIGWALGLGEREDHRDLHRASPLLWLPGPVRYYFAFSLFRGDGNEGAPVLVAVYET